MSFLRPEPSNKSLEQLRGEIDALDQELVTILNRRAQLAREIGVVKGADAKPFFTPEREFLIYERLEKLNPGPLHHRQLVAVFREIISAARAAEKPLSVAYWGPPGTFTHLAALDTFGRSTAMLPQESIADVFTSVEHEHVDYGIVPIENSTAGVVPETLDMFPQTNVKICAEIFIPIHHHLGSLATDLSQIRRIYVGPQPAGQCRRWIRANLPNVEQIETTPTARAGQRAMEDPEGAAIVNSLTLETLGLPSLAGPIEDNPQNHTRFVVLGYNEPLKTGKDKTSLMFSLRNRPGELYGLLGAFVHHKVNLTMIESRPAPRSSFEYIFYADCAGHRSDEQVRLAIEEVRRHALETTVLGSYPTRDPKIDVGG